ncbi:MAG: phosphoribosylglycinamide formyltransferase [Tissierellia bacterium]|nr:phosphoribosylglycinamide formyltransferase [Tissierellia bacterium]
MPDSRLRLRIAVFVSGGGTNLQALIDGKREGAFQSDLALVVSNKPEAYGLERARQAGIPTFVEGGDKSLIQALEDHEIDFIVLAGYLKIIGQDLLEKYQGRIINIHPSLLPAYGGMGMYGLRVHEAVFKNGEDFSGATVHFVTEEVDGGHIILQLKTNIRKASSPEAIQKQVLRLEHVALKLALSLIEEEDIEIRTFVRNR